MSSILLLGVIAIVGQRFLPQVDVSMLTAGVTISELTTRSSPLSLFSLRECSEMRLRSYADRQRSRNSHHSSHQSCCWKTRRQDGLHRIHGYGCWMARWYGESVLKVSLMIAMGSRTYPGGVLLQCYWNVARYV